MLTEKYRILELTTKYKLFYTYLIIIPTLGLGRRY